MKWARVENNEVKEIVNRDPVGLYHPSLTFVPCDEQTKERMIYDSKTKAFSEPVPVERVLTEAETAKAAADQAKRDAILAAKDVPALALLVADALYPQAVSVEK